MRWPRWLVAMPNVVRQAVAGAMILGAGGSIAGLVIGLNVYPATAWAATFEVGVPCAVVGFALGAAVGGVVHLSGRSPSA